MSYTFNNNSAGTRCLAETKTEWYNLSTREFCPKLHRLNENRGLVPESKQRRRKLKKNIKEKGMVLQPILCDSDYNVYDGQNRWKIINELWNEGTDAILGITINPWLNENKTSEFKRSCLQALQEGTPWGPLDKLKALSDEGNEAAQCVLELAFKPSTFTKKGIYGIRNAFVAMGRNPDDFETLPYVYSQEEYYTSKRIFDETMLLLKLGVKSSDKLNNWTEAFIKAWRRIRTNDPNLKKEDENGDRAIINTKALNTMIDDIGIEALGNLWRCYADKAYATGKTGRWASVLEEAIMDTYKFKYKRKGA